jgi:hypothetical protein
MSFEDVVLVEEAFWTSCRNLFALYVFHVPQRNHFAESSERFSAFGDIFPEHETGVS